MVDEGATGEAKTVSFALSESDLAFYTADMTYAAEPGQFIVFIGGSSVDVQQAAFELLP